MEYVAFVFGIFGFIAFLQLSSLKGRIYDLEEQLARMDGSSLFEERTALQKAAKSYIGKKVSIALKEDHEDADIMMYGNTKHGKNTILDVDEEWMLVHIETPKGEKEKMIRLGSVKKISQVEE